MCSRSGNAGSGMAKLKKFGFLFQFVLLLLIVSWQASQAAVIQQVGLEEMTKASEFVFEGRVISVESRFDPDGSSIRTWVDFKILEVIKGKFLQRALRLSFLGGTVGDLTLKISDMEIPRLFETGIYFVETLQRRQVHPFYGWQQGHFLIIEDKAGIQRVMTQNRKPVTGIALPLASSADGLSHGVASGLNVAEDESAIGLTANEFKQALRQMIGGQQ